MGVYMYEESNPSSKSNHLSFIDSTKALTGKDAENCLTTKANKDGSVTCKLYKTTNSGHVFLNINSSRFVAKMNQSPEDNTKYVISNCVLAKINSKNI
uniref:DUF1508 domain-containing protein n=1 Tax=Strongyloides stercoralis TaxID=6248 RepID=A0A0K0EGE5_STRER